MAALHKKLLFEQAIAFEHRSVFEEIAPDTMAVEADYVYVGSRDSPRPVPMNLTFNPATGANYPFSDISRRPYPEWGWVRLAFNGARANLHQLQTAFTKRLSNG